VTSWSLLFWNMALGSKRNVTVNGAALASWVSEERIDVTALNEARFASDTTVFRETDNTEGKDRKQRNWTTALVSERLIEPVTHARPVNYLGHPRMPIEVKASRAGSWTVGEVTLHDDVNVVVIAVYGLLDMLSDQSMHLSLSELSPLFDDPEYRDRIVLAGDFNLTTQWSDERLHQRAASVFARLDGFGLKDCLAEKRTPGRLEGCTCGGPCSHTRTKWIDGRDGGGYPHQMDYVYASSALIDDGRLVRCEPLDTDRWKAFSDHAPIVATFALA
jgi:endonuclease/exonuclease/phosphatase family metal-dependent hydrolase